MHKPAILGGEPLFDNKLEMVAPVLPKWDDVSADIKAAYMSGRLTNFGPFCAELEERLCGLLGCQYAVTVSSATVGLQIALASTKSQKKEVLIPSFTFAASLDAVIANGMLPRYVDIDPETWNLCPESVESAVSEETAAIVPVHVFGNPCHVEKISAIAKKFDLKVIYDAAHALGAEAHDTYVGSNFDCEVFSLSTTKVLPASEGGVITTNNSNLAESLRISRNYGYGKDYNWQMAGNNGKLTEMSAIIALRGLPLLQHAIHNRNNYAKIYHRYLQEIPGLSFQIVRCGLLSPYKDFGILIDEPVFGMSRDLLALALREENIDTRPYFFPAVHKTSFGRTFLKSSDNLLITEKISNGVLCLPIHSEMQEVHLLKVTEAVRSIHKWANEIKKVVLQKG